MNLGQTLKLSEKLWFTNVSIQKGTFSKLTKIFKGVKENEPPYPALNFKHFISTCVEEITEIVSEAPNCFRYIKSSLNPAQALTKPVQNFKLSEWYQGPNFLLQSSEQWPKVKIFT